eukprot:CAMPEP_0194480210 /NCGR_PEP_ID=MMETSP0253-20130528/3092_1 /TAXON_ID=2966 /ORGANISM="Noctiluca scintillans" /LENGTH=87 /DNA_ID=CAMNT_0039319565 /DNA_START=276 /DNA_END=539 /DNA_ORIENTATION=+
MMRYMFSNTAWTNCKMVNSSLAKKKRMNIPMSVIVTQINGIQITIMATPRTPGVSGCTRGDHHMGKPCEYTKCDGGNGEISSQSSMV